MKSHCWGRHARRMERMDKFNTVEYSGNWYLRAKLPSGSPQFLRMGVATHVLVTDELGSSMKHQNWVSFDLIAALQSY